MVASRFRVAHFIRFHLLENFPGLAILRRFAMSGLRCVLLERGADILSGASKGNSALLHTGFDAPAGSLELACMQAGYEEYLAIRTDTGITGIHNTLWRKQQHIASFTTFAITTGENTATG